MDEALLDNEVAKLIQSEENSEKGLGIRRGDWSFVAPAENSVACTVSFLTDPVKGWDLRVAGKLLTFLAALIVVSSSLTSSSFPLAKSIELPDGVSTSQVDAEASIATEVAPATSAAAHARSATKRAHALPAATQVRNAKDSLRTFEGRIPGSKLKTAQEVAAARSRLACFAQRGRWVLNPQPRLLPWNVDSNSTTDGRGVGICDSRWRKAHFNGLAGPEADQVTQASKWDIRPGLKYEWQPSKECGQWHRFQPASFCAAMERLGGPLLLVGDSLTGQMMDSMHNLLQINTSRKGNYLYLPDVCKPWEKRNRNVHKQRCRAMALCGPNFPVFCARNDHLSISEEHSLSRRPHWTEFHFPWLSFMETVDTKAVVLNRGLHFVAKGHFTLQLEHAVMELRERHPDLLILFRSSVAGHEGCEELEVPLEKPQERAGLPFHWGDMHNQNRIARRIVEKCGGVFLDVEPMTELRGDGHIGNVGRKNDCLHYCSPGPVDEWNKLLLNALSILL